MKNKNTFDLSNYTKYRPTNHERINLFGYSQFNSATQNYQKDSMKSMYNLTDRTITIAFYSHL